MGQKIYSYAVKPAKKKKRRGKKSSAAGEVVRKAFLTLTGIIVISGLFLVYNLQYSKVNSNLVAIRKMKIQIDSLQNVGDKLNIRLKRLTHVTRIHRIAEKKLGLSSRSARPVVFYVDAEKLEQAEKLDKELNEAFKK